MGKKHRRTAKPMSAKAKWIIFIVCAVLVIGGLLGLAFYMGWLQPPQADDPSATAPTGTGVDETIHFIAGGDLNVTDKTVSGDPALMLRDLMPVLSGGDLTAVNFEGNFYGEPYGSLHSSAPQALAQALRDAGVDILQTANSKSITNGLLGLNATLKAINAAQMQPLGTCETEADHERYQGFIIREIRGIRIAITAFTKGMDGRGLPAGSEHCVNLLYTDYNSTYQTVDEEGINDVLSAMAAHDPDVTIALLHWGSEFNDQISKSQNKICEIMSAGGVDAIIGTHPHYVQKIEFQDSGMLVAYSLGDLCGDGEKAGTNYSVLLDLQITRDGQTGAVSITGYDYVPIFQYEVEGQVRLVRIKDAMAAYERHAVDAVPQEVYEQMKAALKRIEERVNG